MLVVEGEQLRLSEVGVHFDLVDRRHHLDFGEQFLEVSRHEVGDADRADLAVGVQLLQRFVGADGQLELAGQCLMQDQQVELFDAELAHGLVKRVQRGVVAEVGDPDLGLDEDVLAGQPGPADRFSDLALVAVRRRGVDVAVAGLQRRLDGGDGLVRCGLEDAEAQHGYLDAVVEGEGGNAHVLDARPRRRSLGVPDERGIGSTSQRAAGVPTVEL